jgi:hypothetical protein
LRGVDGLLGPGVLLQQLALAPELYFSVLELRRGLRDRGFLDVYDRLERRALQCVKQIPLLDVGTFREKLLSRSGHARFCATLLIT